MGNKIGIITFHASHNCGSFMQAFALQTFLRQHNYPNEIINFSNPGQRDLYRTLPKANSIKGIIKNIILLPHHRILRNTSQSYQSFIDKYLTLSKESFREDSQLKNYNFPYDTYISGSDQVWNITIPDSDTAYFLDFVKKGKKIAYSPSFGARKIADYASPEEYAKYQELLKAYDNLSIREKNGQKWLKEMVNREIPIVLDPTLLLDTKDYNILEDSYDSKIDSPYIFYYSPSYNPSINKLVQKISKKYHLKVVAWNPKNYYLKFMGHSGFYLPKKQNPGVYLSLIKNASLVITTSFHGTIFSTIYKKNFWTIKNGDMFGDDDRVKTLIEQLGITDRLISMDFNKDFDYMKVTDYKQYKQELPKLQEKSANFLLGALGNG